MTQGQENPGTGIREHTSQERSVKPALAHWRIDKEAAEANEEDEADRCQAAKSAMNSSEGMGRSRPAGAIPLAPTAGFGPRASGSSTRGHPQLAGEGVRPVVVVLSRPPRRSGIP